VNSKEKVRAVALVVALLIKYFSLVEAAVMSVTVAVVVVVAVVVLAAAVVLANILILARGFLETAQ